MRERSTMDQTLHSGMLNDYTNAPVASAKKDGVNLLFKWTLALSRYFA